MRIVLNLYAILLLITIYLLRFLLGFLNPQFDEFTHPYFWLLFYVVSGLGEIGKIKGRIFWLPMWLIGFVGFIISSYSEFQSTGFYTAAIVLIGLYALGFVIVRKLTIKGWNKAIESLEKLKGNSLENKKKLLKEAFYVPNYLNPDNGLQYMIFGSLYQKVYYKWMSNQDVNQHYQDFIDVLKNYVTETEYKRYLAVFRSSLVKIQEKKEAYLDQHMFENIIKLISNRQLR